MSANTVSTASLPIRLLSDHLLLTDVNMIVGPVSDFDRTWSGDYTDLLSIRSQIHNTFVV